MSTSEEINRREVAYRLFAAEFEDADYSYAESDEERAPNYVVTPTGARVNRLFVVGVLTEVEAVSEDVVRARVVDPTGAFVVYAGQYQPEALAALESAETPSFVAVTGKARTFEPDDSDVVYTSVRPESVSEVDADTRDRWNVATAEQTVDRVATMAAAHGRVERGDDLRAVLESAGVEPGLAAGIPLALDHYGTTPAYLAAVRDLALDAARVVAGEVDAAGDLDPAPDEGGDVALDFAAELEPTEAALQAASTGEEPEQESGAEQESESGRESESTVGEERDSSSAEPAADPSASGDAGDDTGEVDDETGEADAAEPTTGESDGAADASGDEDAGAEATGDGDEMYDLSEEEREEVKENYGVEFSSGTDIPEGGEEDIEAGDDADDEPAAASEPGDVDAGAGDGSDGGAEEGDTDDEPDSSEDADDEPDADEDADDEPDADEDADDEPDADGDDDEGDDLDDFTEDEYDEPESDSEDEAAGSMDLGLEDYVVDLMEELDDGDGAPREAVIATAADERDADEGEVEDAIQDALMSGRCYESGDDHLKAI